MTWETECTEKGCTISKGLIWDLKLQVAECVLGSTATKHLINELREDIDFLAGELYDSQQELAVSAKRLLLLGKFELELWGVKNRVSELLNDSWTARKEVQQHIKQVGRPILR